MSAWKNTILGALPTDSIERLQLEPIDLEVGHEIEFPGKPITHLYFVEEGMASRTVTFDDGTQVEVGMFGYESVIGVSALMGSMRSLNRVYTQIRGNGQRCTLAHAQLEFKRNEVFHDLALRYVQAQLLQTMQSAGCNAKHETGQRLARWLLLCADRAHTDTFSISQEFLADMLGTQRTTITMAAMLLKQRGTITYKRGQMQILDRDGLEKEACECYAVVRDYLKNREDFDSGIVS